LFDDVIPLPQIKKSKEIVGIGLSDSDVYAKVLKDGSSAESVVEIRFRQLAKFVI
jgi:hypothetical protein